MDYIPSTSFTMVITTLVALGVLVTSTVATTILVAQMAAVSITHLASLATTCQAQAVAQATRSRCGHSQSLGHAVQQQDVQCQDSWFLRGLSKSYVC